MPKTARFERWSPVPSPAKGDGGPVDPDSLFRTESWKGDSADDDVSCADCGSYRDLIGPFSHDGEVTEGGDMICPDCAENRGADLTHCACGVSSPRTITCPGCNDYLGYHSGGSA